MAVVLAVLAASVASYFAARNSLLNSVDGTLAATATSIITHGGTLGGAAKGFGDQYVNPSGTVLQKGDLTLPISPQVQAVAAGHQHDYYDTIALNGQDYRELVRSIGTVRVRVVTPRGVQTTYDSRPPGGLAPDKRRPPALLPGPHPHPRRPGGHRPGPAPGLAGGADRPGARSTT